MKPSVDHKFPGAARAGRRHRGSSLIEMMVALFILAVGMLGVLSMQVKSMQFSQTSYYYSQAVFLANEIVEQMRSSPDTASTYVIGLDDAAPTPSVNCQTAVCTAGEFKNWTLKRWRDNVASSLVSGRSSVERDGGFYKVTVQFDDSRGLLGSSAEPVLNEYVLVTEIN